eukprot:6676392-Pyramimonas_sp.AAC.1
MGPRIFKDAGCVAPPIIPLGGLVAGARRAPDFAKCQMFSICEMPVSASSLVQLRTWIDDVTQRAEGTRRDVVDHLVRAGVTFARGCAQE